MFKNFALFSSLFISVCVIQMQATPTTTTPKSVDPSLPNMDPIPVTVERIMHYSLMTLVMNQLALLQELCQFQPLTGRCNAYFIKWYYDVNHEQCLKFVYGGCGGNKNNFQSLEDCKKTCVAQP